jgi:hypothetical protein
METGSQQFSLVSSPFKHALLHVTYHLDLNERHCRGTEAREKLKQRKKLVCAYFEAMVRTVTVQVKPVRGME